MGLFDVIGMTNMPEAKLAREAELPYASLGDGDRLRLPGTKDHAACGGRTTSCDVLHANAVKAQALVARLAGVVEKTPRTPALADTALDGAIITAPAHRDPAIVRKLQAVAGRVLGSN